MACRGRAGCDSIERGFSQGRRWRRRHRQTVTASGDRKRCRRPHRERASNMTAIAPRIELPAGELPAGELPAGEAPAGELPAGLELVQQLIDTVTAHPEVREPLLRALLTEDFLALPERVSRLQESFDDFRDETRAEFGRVNARLDANTDAIAANTDAIATNASAIAANTSAIAANTSELEEHRRTLAEHSRIIAGHTQTIAENSRIIAGHTQTIAENTRSLREIEGHVGRWRGADYENLCRVEIGAVLDGFLNVAVLADRERIKLQLENARADNLITRAQYLDGLRPDIIARGHADKDEVELLMVGECSITFNRGDLETAYRRAKVIEQVTGVRTQAFLVTHRNWPPEIEDVARQLRVAIIQHQSDEHADQYVD